MVESAEVPALVGMIVRDARQAGHERGFVVTGPDLDGPSLGALTWPGTWTVVSQEPAAGVRLARGERVTVLFKQLPGGDMPGDREPRRPKPAPSSAKAEAEVEAEAEPQSNTHAVADAETGLGLDA